MKNNGKPKKLRFAALRRVSTEQQKEEGESLRTQTKDIEEAATRLGGLIVEWYGGQEHATPGYEKRELNRLLADAQRSPLRFDAVLVAHPDRWSRDNSSSRAGLEIFREHGIRFFAGDTEYDLFNPDHELFLGISAVIGQFQARNQMKKSLINRIHRAKRGIPTAGKLPFGRNYVREKKGEEGRWEVDREKQKMILDCAQRYLAGESLTALAAEYNVNAPNLHKVLTKVSGTDWKMTFTSKVLNIDEVVTFKIPSLLPDEMIRAVRARFDSNRTFTRGHIKHRYLFSRMIRCAHCGYAMFGQTNHQKDRYYRHAHTARENPCPGPHPKMWISAEEVEDVVMRHLFETFGNPTAVAKAISEATPHGEKIKEALLARERITNELTRAKEGMHRVLDYVLKGTISEADATSKLSKQKEKMGQLEIELSRVEDQLAHVPNEQAIRAVSSRIAGQFRFLADSKQAAKIKNANRAFEKMTWEERRALCQMVFSGRAGHGAKLGVSVIWKTPKKWKYRIEGHFIEAEGGPLTASQKDGLFEFGSAYAQKDLVTKNGSPSRGRGLPEWRCGGPGVRWSK